MQKTLNHVTITIEEITERAGTKEKEVHIVSGFRTDILQIYRDLKGKRRFTGFGNNYIALEAWPEFIKQINALEKVTVIYRNNLKIALAVASLTPTWFVDLEIDKIKLTPGPRYSYYDIQSIPGLEYVVSDNNKSWRAPLSQGWKVYKILQDIPEVVYSDDASRFILHQIEQRKAIDEIAIAKDWQYDVKFALENFHLRPYQKVAGAFIEATGVRALVSYDMGLGKTPISLSIAIKHNYRTLVICPASLKPKWAKEIYRLTGIKPVVLMGRQPEPFDTKQMLIDKSRFYLANYETVSKPIDYHKPYLDGAGNNRVQVEKRFLWIDLINLAKFDLIIIDESHYAKNSDSNRSQAITQLKSKGMIHLTGTPVLNRPGEYFPTLHQLRPDLFPSEMQFIKQFTYDGKTPRNTTELADLLKTVMIRRRQQDVRDEVPPKNIIPEYHELSDKAKKLYNQIEGKIVDLIAEHDKKRNVGETSQITTTHILAKIQRLKWVCAIDKARSTADLAIQLHDTAVDSEHKHKKVLIFTQYLSVNRAISRYLGSEALSTVWSRNGKFGSYELNEREEIIQQFQNDKTKNFLVTTLAAKEGHDITEAGFVIFNDLFWTPAHHEQCEGRAYMRENDPHGIDSYYEIIDMDGDSVEEWIWELLHIKADIIDQVVDGVERSRDVSIANELIDKFRAHMFSRKR